MAGKFFNYLWYQRGLVPNLLRLCVWPFLWPLAQLFTWLAKRRKDHYLSGLKPAFQAEIPVIVVGNINVGGTAKSPVTIWVVEQLLSQGYQPGVVSRGYGGQPDQYPHLVNSSDDASTVGDEPLMIHLRTGVPVVVDPDRASAVQALRLNHNVNVIVSDDGLQHYPLSRTFELLVVDGVRGFGNGQQLPLGPLREPLSRAAEVDAIIINGGTASDPIHCQVRELNQHCFVMNLEPGHLVPFNSESKTLLDNDSVVEMQSVAGIGNPQRFFDTLDTLKIKHQPRSFNDHHSYSVSDVEQLQRKFVVTTEKDAVKLARFRQLRGAYLPVNARVQDGLIDVIIHSINDFRQHNRHRY